jgi:hypothetical protein
MALCWLLFGGWRGAGGLHAGRRGARGHMLTDQERDYLRASMARDGR